MIETVYTSPSKVYLKFKGITANAALRLVAEFVSYIYRCNSNLLNRRVMHGGVVMILLAS